MFPAHFSAAKTRVWKSTFITGTSKRLLSASARPTPPRQTLPAYLWVSAAGGALVVGYSYYAFLDQVPLTNRSRWLATSEKLERQMGDSEYRKLLQQFRKDILPPSHRATATVHRVGDRIAQAAQEFVQKHNLASSVTSRPFTYTVVRSDTANAFVLPGNHVFVMTGLFRYARNEDDLASVLGHEVAHTLARHAGERISGSILTTLLSRTALLLDPSGTLSAILVPTATILRELPHSRTQELEADQIGIELAASACYDPRAAQRVFQAMQGSEGQQAPAEFLSTHPSHESRIRRMDDWMPDALHVYRHEKCGSIRRDMELARRRAVGQ